MCYFLLVNKTQAYNLKQSDQTASLKKNTHTLFIISSSSILLPSMPCRGRQEGHQQQWLMHTVRLYVGWDGLGTNLTGAEMLIWTTDRKGSLGPKCLCSSLETLTTVSLYGCRESKQPGGGWIQKLKRKVLGRICSSCYSANNWEIHPSRVWHNSPWRRKIFKTAS